MDCGDQEIRSHVTIELHSRYRGRIQARGENKAPYFLYGNNGSNKYDLDVFKGDIYSREGKTISYYLTTNVDRIGFAYPYKTDFKFIGRCHYHHGHGYDHGRDGQD